MRIGVLYIGMAYPRVQVSREVLEWAVDYSRRGAYLFGKYPKLQDWLDGTVWPTARQLRDFARDARVAEGWMYGSEPPDMKLDIPDMRTVGSVELADPSPDLIDTVFDCQIRQDWYMGYAEAEGLGELEFVGTCTTKTSSEVAAASMREHLGFGFTKREATDRNGYRAALVDCAENAGVLVMMNGVVGNNTRRKLDINEFRGFALSDRLAPLVFVNTNDSLSAQLFTIAHELGHIWLGESAISAPDSDSASVHPMESWCNAVAAEFLVPISEMLEMVGRRDPLDALEQLGRRFKVSDHVLLRRLRDADLINGDRYRVAYKGAVDRARAVLERSGGSGGNFYATLPTRVSRRFLETLYLDTQYGNTQHAEAYRLSGVSNGDTFDNLGRELGIEI